VNGIASYVLANRAGSPANAESRQKMMTRLASNERWHVLVIRLQYDSSYNVIIESLTRNNPATSMFTNACSLQLFADDAVLTIDSICSTRYHCGVCGTATTVLYCNAAAAAAQHL